MTKKRLKELTSKVNNKFKTRLPVAKKKVSNSSTLKDGIISFFP